VFAGLLARQAGFSRPDHTFLPSRKIRFPAGVDFAELLNYQAKCVGNANHYGFIWPGGGRWQSPVQLA
jgi:hypothetical protein